MADAQPRPRLFWLLRSAACYGSPAMRTVHNRYYALRHGISVANEAGIVVSHPENGVAGYGLSERGAAECRRRLAPALLSAHAFNNADTVVYTSDFLRATQTARIFCESNGLEEPISDIRLRERNFGGFENTSIAAYDRVWERDVDDDSHALEGCESTAALALRLTQLLDDLERRWRDKKIVLVSHGDPLQVLQTILLGLRCNQHRTLPHLENAELRRVA